MLGSKAIAEHPVVGGVKRHVGVGGESTMKCMVKLYRPYDRSPRDHKYGRLFDKQLDLFIGGSANWKKPADAPDGSVAEILKPRIRIELHESGPEFTFFIENGSEIANYKRTGYSYFDLGECETRVSKASRSRVGT